MAVLLARKNGNLIPTTRAARAGSPLSIGRPIGISLLTFFPGTIKRDWGGKAEIMISSEIRVGPSNQAAPRRINMLLRGYDFRKAPAISDYGGDVYGDPMLHYSRAYAGQRVGITLRGVETDKFSPRIWGNMERVVGSLGELGLFAAALPYVAQIRAAARMARILVKAIGRNDRLQTSRVDLFFEEQNKKLLQAGRYLVWSPGPGATSNAVRNRQLLTGSGEPEPNILVSKDTGEPFRECPYFVLQIDSKERKAYDDFEIGSGSARLLEIWGDETSGTAVLDAIQQLAEQVNDATQLSHVGALIRDLDKAGGRASKQEIKKKIEAHARLLTAPNSDLLVGLLATRLGLSTRSDRRRR